MSCVRFFSYTQLCGYIWWNKMVAPTGVEQGTQRQSLLTEHAVMAVIHTTGSDEEMAADGSGIVDPNCRNLWALWQKSLKKDVSFVFACLRALSQLCLKCQILNVCLYIKNSASGFSEMLECPLCMDHQQGTEWFLFMNKLTSKNNRGVNFTEL